METAQAVIVKRPLTLHQRYRYRIANGQHEGIEFVASDDRDLNDGHVGSTVTVTFHPQDQFARRVVPPKVQREGFELNTRAITTCGDRAPKECAARVRFDGVRPVLVIEGTPGQWNLSTLLGLDSYHGFDLQTPGDVIALDFGQRWTLTNLRALLTEALARVLGETLPVHS